MGEIVPLNDCHPMRIELSKTNEPSPYVLVRKNLEALLSRNVFYQLVEEAEMDDKKKELFLMSSNHRFSLGVFE